MQAVESDNRWLHRIGGVSALLLGTAYLVIIPLFARVGAPPSDGEVWLNYLAGKTTVWWAILALCVFTDFLFVPVTLSLYVVLERCNKYAMLLASACIGLFVVLDLSVTWTNYGAILILHDRYAAATSESQRATYIAAANYAAAVLSSRTEIFYSIVDLSVAIFLISLVMLRARGPFSKTTALLGLAAGIFGIIASGRFFVAITLNALLTTFWLLFVGYQLFRMGTEPLHPASLAEIAAG